MSEAGPTIGSLRNGRREIRRLEWAILLSLLLHLLLWGGYELAQKEGWFQTWPVLAWLHRLANPPLPIPPPPPVTATQEPQLSFIQVADASPDAPVKPKFYSNKNSHAANQTTEPELADPKLTGQQTDMARTETAPRTHVSKTPPQPVAKPTKLQEQPEKEQIKPLQPQPVVTAGDLSQGQAQLTPQQNEAPHPPKPRTIREALAQLPNTIQGLQMRQNGGVHRTAIRPSFDAKETPFGDYDAMLTQAVEQKWDDLLDERNFSGDCKGQVTVHFNLNYDGSVTEAKIVNTTVDTTWAYLCLEAITAPSPFAAWPEQMRREIGGNVRAMDFTFYYY